MKANLQGLDNTLNGQVKVQLALLKTHTDSLVVSLSPIYALYPISLP